MKRLLVVAFVLLSSLAGFAQAQSLSASPSTAYAGETVTANWSGIASPTGSDWIGLFAPGAANNAFINWRYTTGTADGNVPFLIPVGTAAGTYELRLFANDGFTVLATSGAITVNTPPAATVSATPSSAYAGVTVTAAWTNIVAPSATDWIGLFAPGAANNAFINWRYTTGTAAADVPFLIPVGTAAGTYELRLFSDNGFTVLATSTAVTVTAPPPATISASPTSVPPGSAITAAWTNIVAPTGTDWIGLYTPGAADNVFTAWRYTTGTAAGDVPFDIAANVAVGTYQLRLFTNDGFTRLATSANFSVGTTKLFFIHPDHLNTPRLISDSTGTAVWKWDQQEPFGVSPPDKNPSALGVFDFPLRHPGQYDDPETGLFYNYFRDCYDPVLGRYCQSDPIGLRGGINTYNYVNSNPLSLTDPMGLLGQGNYSGLTSGWPAKQLPTPNNPYSGYNWCGPGANAALPPTNCVDAACQTHDRCYDSCGVRAGTRWFPSTFNVCALKCDMQWLQDHKKCKDDEFCKTPRPTPPSPPVEAP